MKQQFVETIKIKNGKALALPYHQARVGENHPQVLSNPRI